MRRCSAIWRQPGSEIKGLKGGRLNCHEQNRKKQQQEFNLNAICRIMRCCARCARWPERSCSGCIRCSRQNPNAKNWLCLFDCMPSASPQLILLNIVFPSGWNEGLITSTVRVMHAERSQITLFWVWLQVSDSLSVVTAFARPCLCPLSVSPPPLCPTSSVSSVCISVSFCVVSDFSFVLCVRRHGFCGVSSLYVLVGDVFVRYQNWLFNTPTQATYDTSSFCTDSIDRHVQINYWVTDRRHKLQHLAAALLSVG